MIRAFTNALICSSVLAGSADYRKNGADWHDLCSEGKEQSPINLSVNGSSVSDKMQIKGFNYYDFPVNSKTFSSADPTMTTQFEDTVLR